MAERFIIEIDFSQTRKTPMSKKLEPAQGGGNPKQPLGKATPVAQPDGKAIIRAAGRDVARKDRADHEQRAPQSVGGKQNWRRG
ncbi:hypothetical protein [Bradyrhizobium sp. Tv2a-2]|uniref:hypothetical protein n=1 Tax=Bradyrhizobium sp. Tv2a-2 TaxID=113395 RepID=UPI000566BE52|nr:hypothetical protein [Bradyrhizobium sp. Tv2a-2]